MSDTDVALSALRRRREATIERLCQHFARDEIEADELERLIDRAHRATTAADLDVLVARLPALPPSAPGTPAPAQTAAGGAYPQLIVAIMGGAHRGGEWTPARQMYVTSLMGGAVLDFRHARLQAGLTEVVVLAVMGGVEIIVPPDLCVESNGIGIMGGFEHIGSGRFPVDSSGPVLRITGLALMGGVEIKQRGRTDSLPSGETPGLSRKEARRLRRL